MFVPSGDLNIRQQSGFILPFVLMTLAAVSLIAISAYAALTRSTGYMRLLQDQSRYDLGFFTAEAEATYTFLVAVADIGGMRVPGANDDVTLLNIPGAAENTPELASTIWAADGSVRRARQDGQNYLVSYRDTAGLAAINNMEEEKIIALFTLAGFAPDDAQQLGAELSDFIDPDTERRFRGGERADYRIYQRAPPPDSPLRHLTEMTGLLSIPPDLGDRFWNALTAIVTLDTKAQAIKAPFAIGPLIGTLVDEAAIQEGDLIEQALVGDSRPSDRARFLLTTSNQRGVFRMIEIEKSVNDVQKPFKRYTILEGPTAPTTRPPTATDATASPTLPTNDQPGTDRQELSNQKNDDTTKVDIGDEFPLILAAEPRDG